jgi:hypothetical protein
MIDKVAVPFWLCWSAGLAIALATGDYRLWLSLSAAVGIVVGLLLRARAVHRRERCLRRAAARAASFMTRSSSASVGRSGVDLDSAA